MPIGRPPRLAHLVPGTNRQLKRERAHLVSIEAIPVAVATAARQSASEGPPQFGGDPNILCLPSPEWLPHVLTVTGPLADLAVFCKAAAGPGVIPWVTDYDRLEEDWINAMLTPPPSERVISVDGARILAGQVRERLEQQDQRMAEAAFADVGCPLDLHALVPIPRRILRLGPDDPASIAWLWANWTTTWALRGVQVIEPDPSMALAEGHDAVRYRFWSADWTPWNALVALRSHWPSIRFLVSVRAVSE